MAAVIKLILFATDFSACADRAMGYALTLACRNHRRGPVGVGHTGTNGTRSCLTGSTAERVVRMAPCPVLTVLSACLMAHGVQADHVLKPGLPADAITAYVTRQDYAACPVLTVRQANFGADHQRVVPLGDHQPA